MFVFLEDSELEFWMLGNICYEFFNWEKLWPSSELGYSFTQPILSFAISDCETKFHLDVLLVPIFTEIHIKKYDAMHTFVNHNCFHFYALSFDIADYKNFKNYKNFKLFICLHFHPNFSNDNWKITLLNHETLLNKDECQ